MFSIAQPRPFIPADLIMGRLIKSQSRLRSHELSHFFPLLNYRLVVLWPIDDREVHLICPLLKESRRNLFKFNANSAWHVIRSFSHSLLPSHLNLSSHALIYNLLFLMNLQSDNLCCFIFVLANDRGEIFSCTRCLFSGSMLSLL